MRPRVPPRVRGRHRAWTPSAGPRGNGVARPSRRRRAGAILPSTMHGTIVCGVAAGPESRAAAQLAAALAARLDLRLVLAHVAADGRDAPALATIAGELGTAAETRLVRGSRVDGLAQVAAEEGADLIVLGSRARGARARQLRCSLAQELEAATVVPVLIAPP